VSNNEENQKVVSNVVLVSSSGKSIIKNADIMTPENISEFLPQKETVQQAATKLKELGFTLDLVADSFISVSGSKELFEKVFGVKLERRSAPHFHSLDKEPEKSFTNKNNEVSFPGNSTNNSTTNYYETTTPPKVPAELEEFIETILFPTPPTYLNVEATPPSSVNYDHLQVPLDIARNMDAIKVHTRGITGRGIRIAMVDSGFDMVDTGQGVRPSHPYYEDKNYNIERVIGDPNDLEDPLVDSVGHGTALAACALAVAPGATLIPVKMPRNFENQAASFQRAMNERPDIITCSWNLCPPRLFFSNMPPDAMLNMLITHAVSSGIVVLFACGNGRNICREHSGFPMMVSWPGSHRDVISVGGIFVGDDDSMQASDFASSGNNQIQEMRQCPDLCGLTGMAPGGIYIALPTRAGSVYDRGLSGQLYPKQDKTRADDGWLVASGTSSATAMVAGVAALLMERLRSLPPQAGPSRIKSILRNSCIQVQNGTSASLQSPPQATGAGLVQAYRALFDIDVWIADNYNSDIGLVPTHGRRPKWPPYNHWTSPDIKVFSTRLQPDNLATEFGTSSEFSPSELRNPVYGQTNYVYVRIRNRGTSSGLNLFGEAATANVRLYYATPSTNLVFPDDWNDGQRGVDEQGRITVNGNATNLQTSVIPDPNGEMILAQPFEWQLPSPSPDTIVQVDPDGRRLGHFCLLVRIDTTDPSHDPIIIPPIAGAPGENSIIKDNNIGMKNMLVSSSYSLLPPPAVPYYVIFPMKGGIVGPTNEKRILTKNDLLFDLNSLPKEADVIIQILASDKDKSQYLDNAELISAFYNNGNIHLNSSSISRDKKTPAGIYGINLKSNEKLRVKVSIKLPSNVDYGDYGISIMQMCDGMIVGGLDFIAQVTK